MDIQSIGAIIFFSLLTLTIIVYRKKFILEKIFFPFLYIVMHKTKVGIKFTDKVVKKHPKFVRVLGYIGIVVGFAGMVLMAGMIAYIGYKVFILFQPQEGMGLVLPFKAKGALYVPFFYWIISLIIIAFVHEFGHAIVARAHKIKIKSSGLAVMCLLVPLIPAAFVEPDEKQIKKAPRKVQLSIFAAGPFANIILAFICLGILVAAINPMLMQANDNDGVIILGLLNGSMYNTTFAAQQNNVTPGEVIKALTYNNQTYDIFNKEDLSSALDGAAPGDSITLTTNATVYENMVLSSRPEEPEKGYMGVSLDDYLVPSQTFISKFGQFSYNALMALGTLFFWLVTLNLGIGLFNLLPLGIVDGGRMLDVALHKFFPKAHAEKIWKIISLFYLFLVLGMIVINFF